MELWIFILVYEYPILFVLFILPQLWSLGQTTQLWPKVDLAVTTAGSDSSSCLPPAYPVFQDGSRSPPLTGYLAVPSPSSLGPCMGTVNSCLADAVIFCFPA